PVPAILVRVLAAAAAAQAPRLGHYGLHLLHGIVVYRDGDPAVLLEPVADLHVFGFAAGPGAGEQGGIGDDLVQPAAQALEAVEVPPLRPLSRPEEAVEEALLGGAHG